LNVLLNGIEEDYNSNI